MNTNSAEGRPESRPEVSARHKAEWREFRESILAPVVAARDEAGAKFARALADILKIYQEGERKAHGFAGEEEAQGDITFEWEGE